MFFENFITSSYNPAKAAMAQRRSILQRPESEEIRV
jgi:hypothetical protein